MTKEKFDGLAEIYDKHRPRYPSILIEEIKSRIKKQSKLKIVDLGAGTGIALESLIPILGDKHEYIAIDISADMINVGKNKFPNVTWLQGKVEDILPSLKDVDIITSAQAYQWFDRQSVLELVNQSLNKDGIFAILQNNRDFNNSDFLNDYESLLEETSDGYSRFYRSFDILQELKTKFNKLEQTLINVNYFWEKETLTDDFISMSKSSTQVQRALAKNENLYLSKLNSILDKHQINGKLKITYESQIYIAIL